MNAEISRLAKWASQARGLPAVPAEVLLTALYRSHRLDLIRLAVLLVGDRETAEDIVQDVFARLHGRRPETLTLAYVRTCVLNGSRSVLRRRMVESRWTERGKETLDSSETDVLLGESRREVLDALGRLPKRQRETLVLRYYLDLSESETARTMRVRASTVRSTTARALARLHRELGGNA